MSSYYSCCPWSCNRRWWTVGDRMLYKMLHDIKSKHQNEFWTYVFHILKRTICTLINRCIVQLSHISQNIIYYSTEYIRISFTYDWKKDMNQQRRYSERATIIMKRFTFLNGLMQKLQLFCNMQMDLFLLTEPIERRSKDQSKSVSDRWDMSQPRRYKKGKWK